MTKPKKIATISFLLITFFLVSATNINAGMPDTTPRMPDTTPRMPKDIINSVFGALPRMPRDLINSVFGVLPKMPDTTPVMPDILRFLTNMLPSGIRKFLAPPAPSNLPQPLGLWQREPTKTPAPTIKAEGTPQVGPLKYKSDAKTEKAVGFAVPAFTFSAPGGWLNRTSAGELAAFGSPEEDEEQVDENQMFSVQAVIKIRATDAYSSLDDLVSQIKASSNRLKEYQLISSLPRKINGLDGHSLETKYQSAKDGRTKHELDYLIFKDGVSFLISGIALDSAWGQRGGEIQSALSSFKFD